jgi:hypothetical protein
MRTSFLLLILILASPSGYSQQLQLELQSQTSVYAPVKLSNSGYKYYLLAASNDNWEVVFQNMQIQLLNLNGSPFKTLNIPPKPSATASIEAIYYITETMFDTDPSNIEFMICWKSVTALLGTRIQVVREDGTILLNESDAYTTSFFTTGRYNSVFETDQGTKLQLTYAQLQPPNGFVQTGSKIFILPGNYPTGINPNLMTIPGSGSEALVYPNPSTGEFRIGASGQSNGLNLEFYSMDGKKIRTYDVGPDMKVPDLGLPDGSYLIKATDPQTKQSATKKIIIE